MKKEIPSSKAGLMEGEVFSPTELGTPQGGPLSPLLANIALTGMEDDLSKAFHPSRAIDGHRIKKAPRLIIYADDFVCLHESRAVVEEASRFISEWLLPLGLNLNVHKTKVVHTFNDVDSQRGFEFLGCNIRQHAVGKHQAKPFFKGVHTHISPNQKSQKKIYAACAEIIDKMVHSKKRNAEYTLRKLKGTPSAQEQLINSLNRKLRGWAGYFRHHNSKRAFSMLDHKLFIKLFRWVKRRHPKWRRKRLIDEYFNGANPWSFKSPGKTPQEDIVLMRVDSIPIKPHIPIRSEESYFNGDWAYWAKRLGHYPGIPKDVSRCLKRQNGKCGHCNGIIDSSQRLLIQMTPTDRGYAAKRLVHESCSSEIDTI